MKIGIITYWNSQNNYGQQLQLFALQHYLRLCGHDAYLIRYHEEKNKNGNFLKKLSPKHIYSYINYLFSKYKNTYKSYHFEIFRKNYIHISPQEFHSFQDLWEADWSDTDAFICGSDQIWSPKNYNNTLAYHLCFVPLGKKKIAYACSFGRSTLSSEQSNELKSLTNDFDAISVREQSGVNICSSVNLHADCVCDPTILLHQNEYKPLIKSNKKVGIFCYWINWETNYTFLEVKKLSQETQLPIKYYTTSKIQDSISLSEDCSIESWISDIFNSSFVVTNSFHGTVFAILFHVPFVCIPLNGKDAPMNSRIFSLLEIIGLTNRILSKETSLNMLFQEKINWEEVDIKLEKFRQHSKDFLFKALESKQKPINSKLNICFYTNGSIHHQYGGLDRVTELLTNEFENKGFHIYYLSHYRRDIYDKKRQYFLPDTRNIRSRENAKAYNQFIQDHNIDFVINQEGNVNIHLPLDNKNKKVNVITCLHFNPNYITEKHFINKFSKYPHPFGFLLTYLFRIHIINRVGIKYLEKKLRRNYLYQIANCNYFVLLSDRFKRDLGQLLLPYHFDCSKVVAINNPINLTNTANTNIRKKQILYVGRLDNQFKRIDVLLDIWKETNLCDWKFIIVGDGPDRYYLESYVFNNNISHVEFRGIIDPKEEYQKSSILLLASDQAEGWGMVLVEAQSYGCVPIAYHSYSSIEDIITDGYNGRLITNNDKRAFVSAIKELSSDQKKLNIMSNNCIESVKRFSIERICDRWQCLFNK